VQFYICKKKEIFTSPSQFPYSQAFFESISAAAFTFALQQKDMFKTRKPRGFNLKGRFYDEDKERRDNLLRKNEDEIPFGDSDKYRERLRKNWEYRRTTNTPANYNTRLIVILSILMLILFIIFYIIE